MYEKLRNFRTIHPGGVSLVLKYAQNSNENCHEISRREHFAFRRYRAKSPPGYIYIGLSLLHFQVEVISKSRQSDKHNSENFITIEQILRKLWTFIKVSLKIDMKDNECMQKSIVYMSNSHTSPLDLYIKKKYINFFALIV